MWPNYPVTDQVGTAIKLRQRMKNLPSCAHVLLKTLNLSFHVVIWPNTANKCIKIYNSHAGPLFSHELLLFCDFRIAGAVVAS